jgi:hypothetical protein
VVHSDDVNILGDAIDTIKKNEGSGTSKADGPEVDREKTKYMLMSHHQNAGQNNDIKTSSKSFESVVNLIYVGMTVTNQNLMNEEIKKNRLIIVNFWYHSVNILYSCALYKKCKD